MVWASADLALDGRELVEGYGARCQIEFLFRASNPFPGLADCQGRAEGGRDFHFTAALATLKLARAEGLRAQTEPPPPGFSLARWKHRPFKERWLDVFIENLALAPMGGKILPARRPSALRERSLPDFCLNY